MATKKKPAVTTAKTKKDSSPYDAFKGATISTDRLQPKKATNIYVEIEVDGEIETHLLDLRHVPQDIIDSWKGELV